jgi:hypothetical protein
MEGRVPEVLAAALRPARTHLTSTTCPCGTEGEHPGAVGAGAHPGTPGSTGRRRPDSKQTPHPKSGSSTISNHTQSTLTD